jgi:sugar (pentulose or hexulose) kinase
VESGTIRGTLSESVCKELHLPPIPVAAVCGHRTPCIAFATPVKKAQHAMYIQCGVQSQCGTMLDAPICTPESARLGCRNDVGMDNKIFYGKSCAGLGLIQETRRYLHRCEQPYTYAELEALALKADPLQYFIDPDDPVFSTAGNLPLRVQEYCMRTGQGKPASLGAIIRCIYESLALKYRLTLETLESSTDTHFSAIYLVGSGTKDRLLCQMTADVCNLPVYAGPKEAAVFGNASMQLMALGAVVSHAYARSVIAASAPATVYAPRTDWFDAFARFQTLVQQKYVES